MASNLATFSETTKAGKAFLPATSLSVTGGAGIPAAVFHRKAFAMASAACLLVSEDTCP
jgi:hypothetical protein